MFDKKDFNFIAIKESFDKLKAGQKAEIRRVVLPEDLARIAISYRLLPKDEKLTKQWQRVFYFLPYLARHKDANSISLGTQLAELKLNLNRLESLIHSDSPNDLIKLRDIVKGYKKEDLTVNWQKFGEMLYFWGGKQKQQLLTDYLLSINRIKQAEIAQSEIESRSVAQTEVEIIVERVAVAKAQELQQTQATQGGEIAQTITIEEMQIIAIDNKEAKEIKEVDSSTNTAKNQKSPKETITAKKTKISGTNAVINKVKPSSHKVKVNDSITAKKSVKRSKNK